MSESAYTTVAIADLISIKTRVNLGDQDREIGFETHVDKDAPQAEVDELCDKIMRAADRLRAKHLLPMYRRQRASQQIEHDENRARIVAGDAKLHAMTEAREEQRTRLVTTIQNKIAMARADHEGSGRRQDFKPGPQLTREQDAAIAELDAGDTRDRNEWAIQKAELEDQVAKNQRALDQMDQMITELEALARDAAAND